MEFVVYVLESVFGMTLHEATKLMLDIHHDGSAECGACPPGQASDIVAQVTELARSHGHPLRCISRV